MKKLWLYALALLYCVTATGCASATLEHEIVKNHSGLAKDAMAAVDPATFSAGEFTASDGTILKYRFLIPSRHADRARYPLVLQLHGSGGIGTDNLMQVDRLAKSWAMPEVRARYQTYVLVPQFPVRSANYGPTAPDQHAEHSAALVAALELVDAFAVEHDVDSSRIYATGFSMGGSGAWLSPTLRRNLFAAIVPMSGIAPENASAPVFKNLPTLVIHGNADTENPITADRRFVEEVIRVGGKKIRLREYQGLEHDLADDIYPGQWWRDWLFQQHRN